MQIIININRVNNIENPSRGHIFVNAHCFDESPKASSNIMLNIKLMSPQIFCSVIRHSSCAHLKLVLSLQLQTAVAFHASFVGEILPNRPPVAGDAGGSADTFL